MSKFCMGCMEQIEDEALVCPVCGCVDGAAAAQSIHMEPGSILGERYIVGRALRYDKSGVDYIGWDALYERKVTIREYLPVAYAARAGGEQLTVRDGKSRQFQEGLRKFIDGANRRVQQEAGSAQIFECLSENGTAYAIMEYETGEAAALWLGGGAVSADSAAEVNEGKSVAGSGDKKGFSLPVWAKPVGAAIALIAVLLGVLFGTGILGSGVKLAEGEAMVPEIVSCSVDVAQNRLAEQGLSMMIVGAEYSDTTPANIILEQNLNPGVIVEKGTTVEVRVSADWGFGEDGIMPGVVYKTEAEATAKLASLGLTIQTEPVYSDFVAEGLVISQSPNAGSGIHSGQSVTLEVSLGLDPNRREASPELVTLLQNSCELYLGDSMSLYAQGGTGAYTYESSDESVVTVSPSGELSAVGEGTATVTVKSGEAESAVCVITVGAYQMTLEPERLALFADASDAVAVSGIPQDARVEWRSEDSAVASVSDGLITGHTNGETTITASWTNGTHTYTASIPVTVEASGITLSEYKITSFYVGQTRELTAQTAPADQTVEWVSSDETVVTVDDKGLVTAVGGGSATVTASFGEYSESCEVTVTSPGVSLTKSSVSLYPGESAALSASATPSGTEVTWSSDNSGVATVSGGKISAVGPGTTSIRAKITFEGKTYEALCAVTVNQPGVSLSASGLTLLPGESKSLSATTKPGGCSVTWSSNNTGVATVSGGKVTAVATGSATITAQISYQGKTYKATCAVTVSKPTISVTSSADTITYAEREQDRGVCTLTAKVNPDGGSVKWEISDSSVATISGSGTTATVTAKSAGTATVTATYSVKGEVVSDTCTITVKKADSTMRLDNFAYATSGTIDSFWVSGTITSNYALTRVENIGTATSNALNLTVGGDTTDPYIFEEGVYTVDASILCEYFIEQYRTLYNVYQSVAGLLGADDSVTMNITITCYDASGYCESREMTFVVYGD